MSQDDWQARQALSPLAVMIDNAPAATPQYGLAEADLVYEALVEGGLTRFMAVYWRREAPRVEPIRSARTPFVVWASELGATYAHAGGADTNNDANAIGQIREWSIPDLDGLAPATAAGFYRDPGRIAPHNFAAATESLRQAAAALGYPAAAALSPWRFKEDYAGTGNRPAAQAFEVSVVPGRPTSRLVQWRWDGADNTYLRYQWGVPHLDAGSGLQLRFKTVVVMKVPWAVVDSGGHVLLAQVGEGPAHVMIDGRRIDATWRKTSRTARTRFYDASGAEVSLNRGPVFIQVIGPDGHFATAEKPDGLPPLEAVAPVGPPREQPSPTADPSPTPSSVLTPTPTTSPGPVTATPPVPSATSTAVPPSPSVPPPTPSVPAGSPTSDPPTPTELPPTAGTATRTPNPSSTP